MNELLNMLDDTKTDEEGNAVVKAEQPKITLEELIASAPPGVPKEVIESMKAIMEDLKK